VNTEVLYASIAGYVMLGLIWTTDYWFVDQLTPEERFLSTRTPGRNQSMGSLVLLQFRHSEHRRLWRHHSRVENCALACRHGGDDWIALRGGTDCPFGFTLFGSEIG
jgi:hypothetical protein